MCTCLRFVCKFGDARASGNIHGSRASLQDFAKGIASGGFDQKLKMDDE